MNDYKEFQDKPIVIYDFETNGLLTDIDVQPIQVAIIRIDKEKIITYNELIKTPHAISDFITNLTGITNDDLLSRGIPIEKAMKDIVDLFIQDNPCIVGHNIINFDNVLLGAWLARFDLPRPLRGQVFDTAGEFKAELLGMCKLINDVSFYQHHKNILNLKRKGVKFNLELAGEHYNVRGEDILHDAFNDTKLNARVLYKQLLKNQVEIPQLIIN